MADSDESGHSRRQAPAGAAQPARNGRGSSRRARSQRQGTRRKQQPQGAASASNDRGATASHRRRKPRRGVHQRAEQVGSEIAQKRARELEVNSRATRDALAPDLASVLATIPSAAAAPFVAVSISTTGIHPSTSRLVEAAFVFYDAAEQADGSSIPGREVFQVSRRVNPGTPVGPQHLHGYTAGELAHSPGFAAVSELFFAALNDRSVILHQTALTWGFLVHEFRLAKRMAQRSQRSARGARGKSAARPVVEAVDTPVPVALIDTLGTARRQHINAPDERLRAIAALYSEAAPANDSASGVPAPDFPHGSHPATASAERARIDPGELLASDARLVGWLHLAQISVGAAASTIVTAAPSALVADNFGLQRSNVRVDAANQPREFLNPGALTEGDNAADRRAVQGMEFVVSPDVTRDPDELISRGVAAGLAYSEKLNRKTSLVVCDESSELRGKAMHAHRKNIPLVSVHEFLELLDHVAPGVRAQNPIDANAGLLPDVVSVKRSNRRTDSGRTAQSNANANKGGEGNRRRRRRRSNRNPQRQGTGQNAGPNTAQKTAQTTAPRTEQSTPSGQPAERRRRNRRRGRGNRARGNVGSQNQDV